MSEDNKTKKADGTPVKPTPVRPEPQGGAGTPGTQSKPGTQSSSGNSSTGNANMGNSARPGNSGQSTQGTATGIGAAVGDGVDRMESEGGRTDVPTIDDKNFGTDTTKPNVNRPSGDGANQSQGTTRPVGMQGTSSNATGVNSAGEQETRETMGGKGSINQETESKYWRETHSTRKYIQDGYTFEEYEPAYRMGWECAAKPGSEKTFEQAEPKMQTQWDSAKGKSRLAWDHAKMAVRDAWERVKQTAQGETSSSSRSDVRR